MPITAIKPLHVLQVRAEATEGTDPVPGASHSIQLAEPGEIVFGSSVQNDRPDHLNGFIDQSGNLPPGGPWIEVSGKVHVRGYGAAYSASNVPEIHDILRALGFSATGSFTGGAETWTYDSASTSMTTSTFYAYIGLETGVWVRHIGTAGRVTRLVIEAAAGRPVTVSFTIRGLYTEPTDASPVAPTYQTATPPIWGGTTALAFGGYATPVARSFTLTIENTVADRLNANVAAQLSGFLQTRRRITFTAKVETQRVSDYNAMNRWANATVDTLAFKHAGGAGGGTQYNRITIDATRAILSSPPGYEDENGIWIRNLTGILDPAGANRCRIVYS